MDRKILLLIPLLLLLPNVNAQVLNNTQVCISNTTQQINTSIQIGSGGSYNLINTSVSNFCYTGCSRMTNSCRPDLSGQVFEVAGLTGGFFALLILGIFLGDFIPAIDIVLTVVLGVMSAILGLTDFFSSPFGLVFFGEAIFFIISAFILAYRYLYG